jgi:branched-chain amino acid transport system permease protein
MSQFLLFVLLGLGVGALVAGLGLGIVLSYRGSGTPNVALGAVAMTSAYVFYGLKTDGDLVMPPLPVVPDMLSLGGPWATVPAFLAALAVAGATGALFDGLVLRRLRTTSPLARLLASLGLWLVLQSIAVLRFGTSGQSAPTVIPEGPDDVVTVFGQAIPWDRFVLAGIVVILGVALWAAYRYSRFGLATRAAAEDETKAMLAALPPNQLSMVNNVLAFVLAGALGVLVAPMTQLDPTTITLVIVPALAAALLAGFTSFGIVVAAGLAMGVVDSLVTYWSTKAWFPTAGGLPVPGVAELLFFLAIVVAMALRSGRLPQRGMLAEARLPDAPRARHVAVPGVVLAATAAVALVLLPYDFRQAEINSLIGVVVCLSFVVATGFVGQISVLQVGLAGVAGFTLSKLGSEAGIGFPLAPLLAVLAATLVGVFTAVSSLRVRGVNLAIVTLAGAVALERFVFANPDIGGGSTGASVPALRALGIDLSPSADFPIGSGLPSPVFGFVCVALAAVLAIGVACLRRSELGQRMLAVRSNERAAAGIGVDVTAVKLTAFVISSSIAGVAGCLYAYSLGSVTAGRFGVVSALGFIAFAYLGGITTVSGAIVGGLLVTEGLGIHTVNVLFGIPVEYQLLIAGLALILTIMFNPAGIAGAVGASLRRRAGARPVPSSVGASRAPVSGMGEA